MARSLLLAGVVLGSACSSSPSGTTALFKLSPGPKDDYYTLPFPDDLHRNADGTLDLDAFPTNSLIVDQYRQVAEALDGWALNAAMSSRMSDAIDPTSLPDPAGSVVPGASVYVVNIDSQSPDFDKRTPVIADFRTDPTNTIGPNRLVVRPYPGFGLDEGTTYALVITDRVLDLEGKPIEASSDFRAILGAGGSAAVQNARAVYQPLLDWLDGNGEEAKRDVVSAAVFTTQHATFVAPALRAGVFGTPAPVGANIVLAQTTADYQLWTGTYVAPNFQTGTVPYTNSGGEIQVASGVAIVQRMEPMRFALTVPLGATPATGWPITIYQHGTGGDWESFVDDGTADYLAKQGIAVISTDQVLHGPRNPGADPAISFFNISNPFAARDNALQGAADAWSQQRLALGLSIADTAGSRTLTFDPDRVMFFGHSQGGLTGPGYIAFEPALKGAVLSGTGGLIYLSLLYKQNPIDFASLAATLTRDMPMDEDNPTIALAQMWIERADGANYARFMVREPQTPAGPRNIFQTEGFIDTYAPDKCIEAFATAIGGDVVQTPDEQPVAGLMLRDRTVSAPPIANNMGGATAVLAQYKQAPDDDGHFVVFDIPAARTQSSDFLGTLAATGTATVVEP